MRPNIIMTAGYPEMAAMIKQVSDQLDFSVRVVEGVLREAAQEVKALTEEGGFEVIVSRAGTANEISKLVELPLVYSDTDYFDFVKAFIEAKKYGEKICFIAYPEEGFLVNYDEIIKFIGFDVTILPYKTSEEMVLQVKKAKELGMDVVVGGGRRAANLAKEYGMKSMYLTISERSIKRTLLLAKKVADDRIIIKKETKRLNALINLSEEGILFLNENLKIESCNTAVEKIFHIQKDMVIGNKVDKIENERLRKLLSNRKLYNGKGNFTEGSINITYEPVELDNKRIGTIITYREVSKIQKLETKIRRDLHSKGLLARYQFEDISHNSQKMKKVIHLAREYAATDSTILIIGESGTGKELIAQSIHNASKRKKGPFVAVNCAALPENLLESELFGYAEGAFTGANKGGRQGVFELAHHGTIFLDEIGEIPPHIQTRLLRVLQEKEVMRIGDDRVTPVDIRIIAATNRKLWDLVQQEKFRLDLYFRLSILHLEIPPLYQRAEDIPTVVNHFLMRGNSTKTFEGFSRELQDFFLTYEWPGNVRQLENVIERLLIRKLTPAVEKDFIRDILRETEVSNDLFPVSDAFIVKPGTMDEIEKQIIEQMMERYDDNRTLVAEKMGISRTTLWKKINS
ncbi:sigma 54-interacting transcriptional regulator [Sporosarcina sp. 179-K 3D1 HS]|uniref:sigma 54-interacting transcriptional regulator n=1 Tax=Sporosarcina sp. 179-K 3D1 HS TaxID=3232169 RepID=UPI00399F9E0D